MFKKNLILFAAAFGCAAMANPSDANWKNWDFSLAENRRAVAFRNGATGEFSESPADGLEITLPGEKMPHPPCVAFLAEAPAAFGQNAAFTIRFEGSADQNVSGRMNFSGAQPPFEHVSSPATFQLTPTPKTFELSIRLARPVKKGETLNVPVLVLYGAPGAKVRLKHLAVTASEPKEEPAANVKIQAGKEFRALPEGKLYIKPGSALDFSASVEQIPAGTRGRLTVNGRGELAFERRPDEPVRFLCCSFAHHEELAFRFYTHEELDEFADAIVRQGYNMIRFHYLDEMLSGTKRAAYLKDPAKQSAPLPKTSGEIQFEPGVLDRFWYFVDACGKRGVYLNLDLMSSFTGYDNGRTPLVSQDGERTTKMQLFVNEDYRRNWKAGAKRLLETVNPYNGKALKDDPAVAMACGLNEQEILIPPRDYGKVFQPRWIAYLKEKYGTVEKLRNAWNDPNLTAFEAAPPIGAEITRDTPTGRDMARFCAGLEAEMSEFYLGAMREFGGGLLCGNWNMRPRLLDVPARAKLPVIMLNYYHAHPLYGKYTAVPQDSAIQQGGNINKQFAAMRFLDRPLIGTEYGIPFWNRFRHEQGLLQGAGAALQRWSGMTVFSSPVVYGTRRIECFRAGADPVIRAAQAVEFFAFRRGDIAPARNTVEFPLDDDLIFSGNAMRGVSDSLSRLWPVCRIGITYGKPRVPVNAALRIRPGKMADVGGDNNHSTTSPDASGEDADTVVNELRKRKLLSPENRTDPSKGIFQSDTGEVTVNTQTGEMSVVTPRLEGAVLKSSARRTKLGAFTIDSCSVPASLSLASLDADAELSTAGRLLLIFATDALNSDMEFTSPERTMLVNYGSTPVLLRTGTFSGSLKRKRSGEKFRLYALDLTGERIAELPLTHSGDSVSFSVDTAAIPQAPALFFELVQY